MPKVMAGVEVAAGGRSRVGAAAGTGLIGASVMGAAVTPPTDGGFGKALSQARQRSESANTPSADHRATQTTRRSRSGESRNTDNTATEGEALVETSGETETDPLAGAAPVDTDPTEAVDEQPVEAVDDTDAPVDDSSDTNEPTDAVNPMAQAPVAMVAPVEPTGDATLTEGGEPASDAEAAIALASGVEARAATAAKAGSRDVQAVTGHHGAVDGQIDAAGAPQQGGLSGEPAQPAGRPAPVAVTEAGEAQVDPAEQAVGEPVRPDAHATTAASTVGDPSTLVASDASASRSTAAPPSASTAAPVPQPPPQVHFVEENHPKIVSSVTGQLMGKGGTMQIRLDPPQLGALQVMVELRDGVITASFQTSSDEATRMLSHSLGQLKQTLESHGVVVDRLQVSQAPKSEASRQDGSEQQRQQQGDAQGQGFAQREEQRRQMLRRLWQRLGVGEEALDLVA